MTKQRKHVPTEFKQEAASLILDQATVLKKPVNQWGYAKVPSGQGCDYTSRAFRQQLCRYQLEQSMSRRGHCWDHALMERFFRRYKTAGIPTNGYDNFAEAKRDIALYMKHDNYERGHSVNDSLSPAMALAA